MVVLSFSARVHGFSTVVPETWPYRHHSPLFPATLVGWDVRQICIHAPLIYGVANTTLSTTSIDKHHIAAVSVVFWHLLLTYWGLFMRFTLHLI